MHFLYTILHTYYPKEYIDVIENTLYRVFVFMGLLISCLSQKLGDPDNF
jgi:hypothetical protein